MPVTLKPVETYRDDFTFRNSPEAIARFPFPFPEDSYMYSVNLEPATPREPGSVFEHWFDIDEHYRSEMAERARVLERDPDRCLVMPHMRQAAWDTLEMLMTHLAADYPQWFELERDGNHWTWSNHALDLRQSFVFGDPDTLPCEPLEYITRQVQGDFALLDQRDGNLWMDAGMVTCPADWSIKFDAGMNFTQWHSPVPMAHQLGVFERALKYLLNIQVDHPVRRLNWTMTVNPRLDTSSETFHEWGAERAQVTAENVARLVHLRVELQFMPRLPRSNALLFGIRTYLISLEELASNPAWACRLHRVLRDLPEAIADYKGLTLYRQTVVDWLRQFDPQTCAA
ncbi:heme-dependent oxidative N-demethylase family protein [Pseudomonas aeruginosa]